MICLLVMLNCFFLNLNHKNKILMHNKSMSDELYANEYVLKIRNEEKKAVIRAQEIRKQYREIRDGMIAKRLSDIYNSGLNDQQLAYQLQQFYANS